MNAFHQLRHATLQQSTRHYNARGIMVKRCEKCFIRPDLCICDQAPKCSIDLDFVLIFHQDEIFKPTNSGRLIADCFPQNTHAFIWDRTQPPAELMNILNCPNRQCVIVFPADPLQREVVIKPTPIDNKKLTLIILDATWRQSRRMFNFSQWLKSYPALSIDLQNESHSVQINGTTSQYSTRKAAHKNYLSTAESAALALAQCGNMESAQNLLHYFAIFDKNYQIMKST